MMVKNIATKIMVAALMLSGSDAMCLAQQKTVTYTLEDCLSAARTHNRELQNAAIDIMGSKEQKKEAFSKYLPQISATAMAFRAFDDMVSGSGTIPQEIAAVSPDLAAFAGQPFSFSALNRGYVAAVNVVQPVYMGGQITISNKLVDIQTELMQLQLSKKEKDVLQKVTESYWQIVKVKYNLKTIEASEKQLDAVYAQVKQYVDAGVTTRNDLLRVNLRKQELASGKLKLKNAENVLSLLLAQQIGKAGMKIDVADSIPENVADPAQVMTDASAAATGREEYQMAKKSVAIAEKQVELEKGKLLPSVAVGLTASQMGMGGFSKNVKNFVKTDYTNAMVYGTVSIPISDLWNAKHAVKQKKNKLEQVQNNAINAKEQLMIDIESAWSSLQEAYRQIEVAKASVDEATENMKISNDLFVAGTSTLTDLLDAETLNRQSLDNLAQAKADYAVKLADYCRKTR